MLPITDNHIIYRNSTLKDALKKIDKNSLGTLFLVDNEVFVGTITDGDIRRALLKNSSLDDFVEPIVNKNSYIVFINEFQINEVLKKMFELQIRAVPVLHKNHSILGIISNFEPKLDYPSKNSIVFIMAGGFGTRLDPFTKILPKPLIPFGEKTIIEHIMDNFYKFGFRDFYLSLFYKGNIIKTYFSENERYQNLNFIEESQPLGTGGSLQLLKGLSIENPILIANCDSIIDINFDDFLKYHTNHNFDITILGLLKHFKIPYGVIKYSEGIYNGMDEKPAYDYVINTGFYIINPSLIELIEENEKIDMPSLIDKAKDSGKKVGVYITSSDWFDIGQWDEYKQTLEHFKKLGL